ncbi:hypothetical protein STEG23_005081, partial [Scotinomys teguina]
RVEDQPELTQSFRLRIAQDINQGNLELFLRSYDRRRDLKIKRPKPGQNSNRLKTLKCSTLLVVGDNSPAVEAVVECNSRLNPMNTTLLKAIGSSACACAQRSRVTAPIHMGISPRPDVGEKRKPESGCYSLSIRLSRPASWDRIRHYRIQRLDNGWLYISPRLTFPSLQALVDHYSELADDICCVLKEPCVLQKLGPLPSKDIPLPVTVQSVSLNWKELDSSLVLETPASGEASLLSEGLRESLSSYISLTEENSLDDA